MVQTILRLNDVARVTGLSRSSIYTKVENGDLPKPIRISPRAIGWLESEIAEWQKARIAARDKVAA